MLGMFLCYWVDAMSVCFIFIFHGVWSIVQWAGMSRLLWHGCSHKRSVA